jgi:hypothetical protein
VPTPGGARERYNHVQDLRHKELSLPHRASSSHRPAPKHEATIATLAQETDTDPAVVKSLYEEEIEKLHAQANVKNFIGVIAARRVKQRIATARELGRPLEIRAA